MNGDKMISAEAKALVLDTSIVIRNPTALGVKLNNYQIIIPDIVEREVEFIASKRRDTAGLPSLIRESADKGIVRIERAPSGFVGKLKTSSLTLADALIFQYLEYLQTQGCEFTFVTADQELIELCAASGIATIGQTEFSFLLSKRKSEDATVSAKASRIKRSQWIHYAISLFVGVASSFATSFLFPYARRAFAYINVWGTVAAILLAGIAAYIFRARARLTYGFFEFTFGFMLAARVFWPKFDYATLAAGDYLQILAGVYVMVRGLDNIQKGSKGTVAESLIERIAPSS
jgi:hypothetical protein